MFLNQGLGAIMGAGLFRRSEAAHQLKVELAKIKPEPSRIN